MGENYVTHEECEKYRKEIYDKMNSQDIRVTIIETKFKTIMWFLGLILATGVANFGSFIFEKIMR